MEQNVGTSPSSGIAGKHSRLPGAGAPTPPGASAAATPPGQRGVRPSPIRGARGTPTSSRPYGSILASVTPVDSKGQGSKVGSATRPSSVEPASRHKRSGSTGSQVSACGLTEGGASPGQPIKSSSPAFSKEVKTPTASDAAARRSKSAIPQPGTSPMGKSPAAGAVVNSSPKPGSANRMSLNVPSPTAGPRIQVPPRTSVGASPTLAAARRTRPASASATSPLLGARTPPGPPAGVSPIALGARPVSAAPIVPAASPPASAGAAAAAAAAAVAAAVGAAPMVSPGPTVKPRPMGVGSPSPGIPRTMSRTANMSATRDTVRRAMSVDVSAAKRAATAAAGGPAASVDRPATSSVSVSASTSSAVPAKQPLVIPAGETRASVLRRSASVDKMRESNNARNSMGVRPSTAARVTRPASAAPSTLGPRQPQPPPQPRPASAGVPRVNPSPARARITASPAPRANPSPAPRSQPSPAPRANPSPAPRANPSPARRTVTDPTAASAAKAQGAANKGSILSTIQERPVAIKQPVPPPVAAAAAAAASAAATAALASSQNAQARPTRPMFSLNLAAVKRVVDEEAEPTRDEPEGAEVKPAPPPPPPVAPVPKLNLSTVLQQQQPVESEASGMVAGGPGEGEEVEQSSVEGVSSASSGSTVNAQGHKKGQAAQKKAPPPEPPQDHYYFYPKMDPNEERRTMEAIQRLPKHLQKQMRKIYGEMVEAKQNCEAIAFRGHRLLDQLQNHHRETMATKEQEMLREVQRYQAQAAQAQQELHRLRTVLASSERGSMSSGGGSMSLGASMSIPLSGMGSLPLGGGPPGYDTPGAYDNSVSSSPYAPVAGAGAPGYGMAGPSASAFSPYAASGAGSTYPGASPAVGGVTAAAVTAVRHGGLLSAEASSADGSTFCPEPSEDPVLLHSQHNYHQHGQPNYHNYQQEEGAGALQGSAEGASVGSMQQQSSMHRQSVSSLAEASSMREVLHVAVAEALDRFKSSRQQMGQVQQQQPFAQLAQPLADARARESVDQGGHDLGGPTSAIGHGHAEHEDEEGADCYSTDQLAEQQLLQGSAPQDVSAMLAKQAATAALLQAGLALGKIQQNMRDMRITDDLEPMQDCS